jgi:hypothetical protein
MGSNASLDMPITQAFPASTVIHLCKELENEVTKRRITTRPGTPLGPKGSKRI